MVKVAPAAVARHRLVVVLAAALLACALLAAFGSSARASAGCSIVYTDGALTQSYSDKNDWDAGRVPTSTDNVCFPPGSQVTSGSGDAGTLQFEGDTYFAANVTVHDATAHSEVASGATLELAGGLIAGPNSLDVPSGAALLWDGSSTMSGTGTTTIASGATLTINDAVSQGNRGIDGGRTLTIASGATASWSGTDTLYEGCADGSHPETLEIDGTLTVATDSPTADCGPNLLHVGAGGALQKTAGTGSTAVYIPFVNDGFVHVESGEVRLAAGQPSGASDTGLWTVDSGTDLRFDASRSIATTTLGGQGSYKLESGDLTVPSGETVTIGNGTTFEHSAGVLDGAGTLDVPGGATYLWDGNSSMTGLGATTVDAGGTLTLNDAVSVGNRSVDAGRTLTISPGATATWSGADTLYEGCADGSHPETIDVQGTLTVATDSQFADCGPNLLHVATRGLLQKTAGTGSNQVNIPFVNAGTVKVSTGELDLLSGQPAGVSDTGKWTVASGTDLRLAATRSVATTKFAGAGRYVLSAGSLTVPSGKKLTIAAGTTFEQTGGVLTGAGTLSVPSGATYLWDGNSGMTGLGKTTIGSGGTLTLNDAAGNGNRALDAGRTLTISPGATATWSGTDTLYEGCADGSHPETLMVKGTLTVATDNPLADCGPNLLQVAKGGTLQKTAGTGSTHVNAPFVDAGTVTVSSGELSLDGGQPATVSDTGAWSVAKGADVRFTAARNIATTTLAGAGTYVLAGGPLTVPAGQTLTVGATTTFRHDAGPLTGPGAFDVAGTYLWDGDASMTGTGTTTILSGGTLTINDATGQGNRTLDTGRTLTVAAGAAATWSGTDTLYEGCADGSHAETLNIAGTLTIKNDQTVADCGPNSLHVLPGGQLTKSAGTGTTTVQVRAINDGTITVSAHRLALSSPANYDAAHNTLSGGAYVLSGSGSLQLPSADIHTLDADVTLTGAAAAITDGTNDGLRNLSALTGAGRLALRSGRNLAVAGDLSNGGVVSLDKNVTLTVPGAYTQAAGATFDTAVAGTTPGTKAGHLVAGGAATLDGTLSIQQRVAPSTVPSVEVLTAGSVSGTFATVTGGAGYTVEYGPAFVRLHGS